MSSWQPNGGFHVDRPRKTHLDPIERSARRRLFRQHAGLDYTEAPVFVINGLKLGELIAGNSMILHEIYFASLGEQSEPGSALADALARDFGSIDRWRSEFVAMGKAEGGGSGWVILAWSPRDRRLINCWAADHTTNLAGGQPILVLDMYEQPITWTTAPRPATMSRPTRKPFPTPISFTSTTAEPCSAGVKSRHPVRHRSKLCAALQARSVV